MGPRASISEAVQHSPYGNAPYRRAGRRTSPASKGSDPRAFLNEVIEDKPEYCMPDEKVLIEKGYSELLRSVELFCKKACIEMTFRENGEEVGLCLNRLLGWFRNTIKQYGLDITALRDEDGELTFVVYRNYSSMDYRMVCFYVNPAQHMPKEVSLFYKRFLKYASYVLSSSIDPEYTDNRYLTMLLDCIYEEDEETDFYKLLKKYEKDGEYHQSFLDVDNTDARSNTLYKEMDRYRKKCPVECLDLIECMMDGMEILPHMGIEEYNFCPYYDGYTDESFIEISETIGFFYSSKDGVSDEIESMINSDLNCGLLPAGWNQFLTMSQKMKKEDIDYIIKGSPYPSMFAKWINKFFVQVEKFDKYESNRCTEQ